MSENKKKPISQSSDESQKPRSSSVVEIDVHFDARQLSKTSNRQKNSEKAKSMSETPHSRRTSANPVKRSSMQHSERSERRTSEPIEELKATTGDNYCDRLLGRMNTDGKIALSNIEERYTLKEKLGEGAFAKVYLAIHKETGKKVALKVISLENKELEMKLQNQRILGRKEDVERRKQRQRINRLTKRIRILDNEIFIMKEVLKFSSKDRRSLVNIVEVNATTKNIVFAMELLSGGELFDRVLLKEKYSERDAALILRRIMKGVKALHANGIVHRDLKPENLVFENNDEDAKLKITDFGLAFKVGETDLFQKIIVGSPGYIAPEILTDKKYSYACDIWSLGCILFILLVGGPPFGGSTNEELFGNIKRGIYSFPAGCHISGDAKDLISKMLTVNSEIRYTAAQVLKHPWLTKKANTAQLLNSLGHLRAFNTRKKLKEMAVAMVWSTKSGRAKKMKELLLNTSKEDGFTGEELENIREYLFDTADEDSLVTLESFTNVMTKLGMNDLPLGPIFDLFKTEEDTAAVAEVCVGLSTCARSWKGQDALRYCFDTYDRGGQGKISKKDVQKILKVMMGEDRFDKIAGGMNNIMSTVWKRSPKVSFVDFRDYVMKQGTDWNVRKKVAKAKKVMTSLSIAGYNRLSRIGSNISLATVKTSMIGSSDDATLTRNSSFISFQSRKRVNSTLARTLKRNRTSTKKNLSNNELVYRRGSTLGRAGVPTRKRTLTEEPLYTLDNSTGHALDTEVPYMDEDESEGRMGLRFRGSFSTSVDGDDLEDDKASILSRLRRPSNLHDGGSASGSIRDRLEMTNISKKPLSATIKNKLLKLPFGSRPKRKKKGNIKNIAVNQTGRPQNQRAQKRRASKEEIIHKYGNLSDYIKFRQKSLDFEARPVANQQHSDRSTSPILDVYQDDPKDSSLIAALGSNLYKDDAPTEEEFDLKYKATSRSSLNRKQKTTLPRIDPVSPQKSLKTRLMKRLPPLKPPPQNVLDKKNSGWNMRTFSVDDEI